MIDKDEATRTAIDVMTALTDQQDSTDFVSQRVANTSPGRTAALS